MNVRCSRARRIFFWLVLTGAGKLQAQSPAEAVRMKAVEDVVGAYNAGDYGAMKKPWFLLGRVLVRKHDLEKEFGAVRRKYGMARIAMVTTSPYEHTARLAMEKDSRKRLFLRFLFNDRGRIEGMGFAYPPLDYQRRTGIPTLDSAEFGTAIDSLVLLHHSGKEPHKLNGSVLVLDEGRPVCVRHYGNVDREQGTTLNDSTRFELASCSKQFTAAAILLLAQRGALSLTDTLQGFLPELPYPGITIEQLLTHTSGLPDYEALLAKHWDRSRYATNADVLLQLEEHRPKVLFSPGAHFEYSNTGYVLLALIIERVSGMDLGAFLRSSLFGPLGMRHTRVYNTRRSAHERIDNFATGYVYSDQVGGYILPDSSKEHDRVIYQDAITGDGTVISCVQDLAVWERELLLPRLLPAELLAKAGSEHALKDGSTTGYGYGFFVRGDRDSERLNYHTGGWPGYICIMLRLPDQRRSVVVLSNNSYDGVIALADDIVALLLHER